MGLYTCVTVYCIFGTPRKNKNRFQTPKVVSRALLRPSWGPPGAVLGPSWGRLEAVLGPSWPRLAVSCFRPWFPQPLGLQKPILADFRRLPENKKNVKNRRTIAIFGLFKGRKLNTTNTR